MKKSEFATNSDTLFVPHYRKPFRLIWTSLGPLLMMLGAILLTILIISTLASLSF